MKFSLIFLFLLIPSQIFSQEVVSITEVMVWVKAIDRSGKAITGLTQADFEVFEDGKKMTPTCFEETVFSASDSTTPVPTAQTLPGGVVKRVAVILDLYNTQQFEYLNLKPKINDFFKAVPPNWEIMLATIMPGAIEVNVPFTSNINQLEARLEHISANATRDIEVLDRRRRILNLLDRGSRPEIIEAAYTLAQTYASEEKTMARESIKALERFEKDLVLWKSDSHMVALYISGGINSEPGRQYFDLIERELGSNEFARNSILGQREGGSDLWGMLKKIVALLNRHNITFYTINTRGAISPVPDTLMESRKNREAKLEDTSYLDDTQELMSEIADETGGLYFENSLNFRHGFDMILSDLDHQYLICYKAPPHKKQNEIHKIKVESKKSGVKLRHRKAYME